ncbi:hypothetical protein KP79_PYT18849 [Mizuhopecten yessoensis]|uniref:Uncharacterized protein n=1 Tax=Mizuhopecten yessoensis TaxID=6573 RepID=A0A210QV29_MIZYE|nr:hypothetical protein KP79_PYT18849 [Mizuhopecten yessoensis]
MGTFLLSILVLLFTLFKLISGQCFGDSGPSGAYGCVKLSTYHTFPQWATCLTNDYIRARSRGRGKHHECVDSPDTYCWYQCMCETYDECDGADVYGDCVCDPTKPDTATWPKPSLPSWCFSPDGKTCSWYGDCLRQLYPCADTDAEHAITYADVFCELYSVHQLSFAMSGQQWIDGVRTCLQLDLVPIFRPWSNVTCEGIEKQAFASHAKCYERPTTHASFCSLNLGDQLKIFWTIKGAFTNAFVEPVKDLWDVLSDCLKHRKYRADPEDYYTALIQIFVRKQMFVNDNTDRYAGQIIDLIAKQQKWEQSGIAWFGYKGMLNRATGNEDSTNTVKPVVLDSVPKVRVDILLAVKHVFDLNHQNSFSVNMTDIVLSLAHSMEWGVMLLEPDVPVEVLSMNVCGDINCNSAFLTVTSPLYNDYTSVSAGDMFRTRPWLEAIVAIFHFYLGKYQF